MSRLAWRYLLCLALLRKREGRTAWWAASEGPLPSAACDGAPRVGALRQNLTEDRAGKFSITNSGVAARWKWYDGEEAPCLDDATVVVTDRRLDTSHIEEFVGRGPDLGHA